MIGYPPFPVLKYCWLFITPIICWVRYSHLRHISLTWFIYFLSRWLSASKSVSSHVFICIHYFQTDITSEHRSFAALHHPLSLLLPVSFPPALSSLMSISRISVCHITDYAWAHIWGRAGETGAFTGKCVLKHIPLQTRSVQDQKVQQGH